MNHEKFWASVKKGEPNECWEWQGPRGRGGYGMFRGGSAHRYSEKLARGRIEPGLSVLHNCDNPPCVNPLHLRRGTALANAFDRRRRDPKRVLSGDEFIGPEPNPGDPLFEYQYWLDRATRRLVSKTIYVGIG